jgi:hypothetical protein
MMELSVEQTINEQTNSSEASTKEEEEFRMENLDSAGTCGTQKCLFQLKSNPRIGYLVTQRTHAESLQKTWTFGNYLAAQFGIEQLNKQAPRQMKISKQFASYLNSNLTFHTNLKGRKIGLGYNAKKAMIVQKVKVVPKPYIIVTCRFDKFVKTWNAMDKNFFASVTDAESFIKNLVQSMNMAKELISKERCLLYDFQALLDNEGHLFHYDLDRCFPPRALEGRFLCYKNLDAIVTKAKKLLSNLTDSNTNEDS